MAFNIIIKPIAYFDLEEAIDWYEAQSNGLGYTFLIEFERSKNKLINHPQYYRVYYKTARRILLNRFPYKIYYRIFEKNVIILGLYHGKRSRAFVSRRLKLP